MKLGIAEDEKRKLAETTSAITYSPAYFDLIEEVLSQIRPSNLTPITPELLEMAVSGFDHVKTLLLFHLHSEQEKVEQLIEKLDFEIEQLENNINSSKEENILKILNEKSKALEESEKLIENFQEKVSKEFYYPVVRYVQGEF